MSAITIRGLVNESITGKMLMDAVIDRYYDGRFAKHTTESINASLEDDDYKIVHDDLKHFIGVYDCKTSAQPAWGKEFANNVYNWLQRVFENEAYEIKPDYTKGHVTNFQYDFIITARDLNNNLKNRADYITGMITIDGRTQKILKYVKSVCKKLIVIDDRTFEGIEWYKYYMKMKSSNKAKIVITNSIASIVGMSSYAPRKSNGEPVWRSCQMHDANSDGYARGSWSNIMDEGSLIAYVTDGTPTGFYGIRSNEYEHNAMTCRWMIRLVQRRSGEKYIVVDRGYPNDMYTMPLLELLYDLCKGTSVKLAMFSDYNSGQEVSNLCTDDLERVGRYFTARSIRNIPFTYMCNKKSCDNCSDMTRRMCNQCGACANRRGYKHNDTPTHCASCECFEIERCLNMECSECEHNPCENETNTTKHSHYDDQNGSHEDNGYDYYIWYKAYEISLEKEAVNEAG